MTFIDSLIAGWWGVLIGWLLHSLFDQFWDAVIRPRLRVRFERDLPPRPPRVDYETDLATFRVRETRMRLGLLEGDPADAANCLQDRTWP